LSADPAERNDLSAKHPDIVARLTGLCERARGDLGDSATGRKGAGVRVAFLGK
jgi:hypothetical protein